MADLILAIDQGTSGTKTLILDKQGQVLAKATASLHTNYSSGGFVEQDPAAIYDSVLASVRDCVANFEAAGGKRIDIVTCGISNQRETFVLWNEAGEPFCNAVVWQCKRSVEICKRLSVAGHSGQVERRTGLIIDPYFSGTKVMWLLENNPAVNQAIANGSAFFGTVDTWILYKLTNGKSYKTDYTNASRTLFFNLKELRWDDYLLELFGLSRLQLPELMPSSASFGESHFDGIFSQPLPINAMIGDSHAAAFGEGCFAPGTAKATLGTGCSVLMNIGPVPKKSTGGMITTVCWSTEERVDYAFEGVIVSCGSMVEWLKNELGFFAESAETDRIARSVTTNNGVYLVPAFSGLGAPYWQMDRKASIHGLTFDCGRPHLIRATLEAIVFQLKDVLTAMETDSGTPVKQLMLNGGMTANTFVVELLTGLFENEVYKSNNPDVSALGAGLLAGLKRGLFKSLEELKGLKLSKKKQEAGAFGGEVKSWYGEWKALMEDK